MHADHMHAMPVIIAIHCVKLNKSNWNAMVPRQRVSGAETTICQHAGTRTPDKDEGKRRHTGRVPTEENAHARVHLMRFTVTVRCSAHCGAIQSGARECHIRMRFGGFRNTRSPGCLEAPRTIILTPTPQFSPREASSYHSHVIRNSKQFNSE